MDNTYKPSLLLSLLLGFSRGRYWEWIDAFGCAEAVIRTPAGELKALADQPRQQLQQYQNRGEHSELAQQVKRIQARVDRQGAAIIDHSDNGYPPLLKQIHRPPPLLFVKGDIDVLSMPQIAIVGSRHATKVGLQNSYHFAAFLAKHGFSITSGLAIGIDNAAHRGAVDISGKSIAVMATGIDSIYPHRHRQLADSIVAGGGALVTEFFPGTGVKARHFPQRNRIISGLCAGVLVVEATLKSGSLMTANYALEQSREVFAIPRSIHSPQSKGTHALIKEGAYLVENADDIVAQLSSFLYAYGDRERGSEEGDSERDKEKDKETVASGKGTTHRADKRREDCSQQERLLLEQMSAEPATIDQLVARSGLPAAEISALLIALELKEYIDVSEWGYEKKAP